MLRRKRGYPLIFRFENERELREGFALVTFACWDIRIPENVLNALTSYQRNIALFNELTKLIIKQMSLLISKFLR